MFNTFHADCFLRWPLISCFTATTLAEIHRLPGFGSDRYPLLAVVLETGMRDQQEGLSGGREDVQIAEDKARKENVSERDVPGPNKINGKEIYHES